MAPLQPRPAPRRTRRPGARLGALAVVGLVALSACASASAKAHAPSESPPPVSVVGDSLSILGRDQIWSTFGAAGLTADIDAFPGRTTASQMAALRGAAARPEPVTVVELGTNDALGLAQGTLTVDQEKADVAAALDLFGHRCLVWVDADHDPERLGADKGVVVDDIIRQAAARHPNVHIADLAGILAAHPEYFVADHVHLTPTGYQALASLMVSKVAACRRTATS